MKNVLKIILSVFLIIELCACTKNVENTDLLDNIKIQKSFVVGINENSRPFGYIDRKTGALVGFDADLIREISKQIFNTDKIIKFENVTPSNRIMKLNSGEVDVVISTMTINRERQQIIDFSNPYFMTGQALMVKNNSAVKTGKDLNYKKIGAVLGTTAASNIKYIAPNAIIVGFKNYEEAFKELHNNNVDAISTDDVILQGLIMENPGYKILPDRYSTEFYGIALRKDADSQNLKNAINEVLVELEHSGKLKKLEQKYGVDYRRK